MLGFTAYSIRPGLYNREDVMDLLDLFTTYENKIKLAYENSVTLADAEVLAGEFLYAQTVVSQALQTADMDSRMRKSGLKAIRATVYLNKAILDGKKLSDTMIDAMVTVDSLVQGEQDAFDKAESYRDNLERYFSIFQNAHIFYRGLAKS